MKRARLIVERLITWFGLRQFARSAYGINLIANWEDSTFKFCVSGSYGTVFSEFLRRIDRNSVFLDIGSNQGLYTLVAAKNPNVIQCHAFEPVEVVAEKLRKNVVLNSVADKVVVHEVAISNIEREGQISFSSSHTGRTSLTQSKKIPLTTEAVTVKEVTGSYLNSLKIVENLVIKIDVEGAETIVYEEIRRSIGVELICAMFIEFSISREDPSPLLKRILDDGFRIADMTDSFRGQFDFLFIKDSQ